MSLSGSLCFCFVVSFLAVSEMDGCFTVLREAFFVSSIFVVVSTIGVNQKSNHTDHVVIMRNPFWGGGGGWVISILAVSIDCNYYCWVIVCVFPPPVDRCVN